MVRVQNDSAHMAVRLRSAGTQTQETANGGKVDCGSIVLHLEEFLPTQHQRFYVGILTYQAVLYEPEFFVDVG
jgi:hypothetical protein